MTDAPPRIPILDLGPEIDALWPELQDAYARVLRSGRFILGPEVEAFEQEVAAFLGAEHAVGLNSGTDALVIALRALGIGEGDEVITTPFTFFATAEAISLVGASPVFVDIEPETFNIDPDAVEAAFTSRTRAVLPVHLFGRPARLSRLVQICERHDLHLVEDCAQSFGARYEADCAGCHRDDCDADLAGSLQGRTTGTVGAFGTYSFFPTKNLGAYGDAGMVTTDDAGLAKEARKLRAHGSLKKYHNTDLGYNSRLDALQAAILRVKLPHVAGYNEARRAVAARYAEALQGVDGVEAPSVTPGHVFHQFTVRVLDGQRDDVRARLDEAGVQTMIYYPIPVHRLPVYDFPEGTCPHAERAASEVLSLPIWPQLQPALQDRVVDALAQALKA